MNDGSANSSNPDFSAPVPKAALTPEQEAVAAAVRREIDTNLVPKILLEFTSINARIMALFELTSHAILACESMPQDVKDRWPNDFESLAKKHFDKLLLDYEATHPRMAALMLSGSIDQVMLDVSRELRGE